jgi:pyruvate formate lyase activating enzyme
VRKNEDGELKAESYGRLTSLALDPVEKKPFYHFCPGSRILSVGSYGCNMKCGFCQNHEISQRRAEWEYLPPEKLADLARQTKGNIGVAFTYNEPTIGMEYLLDAAPLVKRAGLKVALVSNGQVSAEPLARLLPFTDAWNIDLKAFTERFYRLHGGDLETAKQSIAMAARAAHVEVTTLVIPGENDGAEEIAALSGWLAGISPEIPLHLSRFFPRYRMADRPPTPKETLSGLAEVARKYLRHVYLGNV